MGKSTKRRNIKRRKTRRRKVKGGRASKAMLYVWQDEDGKTFHKRIFVDDGMDYKDSVTDAGYNLRFLDDGFDNTIPRKKDDKNNLMDIKPFIKTIEADYDANGSVTDVKKSYVEGERKGEVPAVDLDIADRIDNVSKAIKAGKLDGITDLTLKGIFTTESGRGKYKDSLSYDRITQLLNYIQPNKKGEKKEDEEKGEEQKGEGEEEEEEEE